MLSKSQFLILNSCADSWEVFYFPFAEVNYGGQVFAGKTARPDRQPRTIGTSAELVFADLVFLVAEGFIRCRELLADNATIRLECLDVASGAIYAGYDCLTFQDHLERHGYGPHEFMITDMGIKETGRADYDVYVAELGWTE